MSSIAPFPTARRRGAQPRLHSLALGTGLAALGALGVLPARSWAASYGAIRGTVESAHNKPLAGIEVRLRSAASGHVLIGHTDAHGHFAFPTVAIGH